MVSCPRFDITFQLQVAWVFKELVPKEPAFIGYCVRVVKV